MWWPHWRPGRFWPSCTIDHAFKARQAGWFDRASRIINRAFILTSKAKTMTASTVSPAPDHDHPNQFALLKQKRFAPFFWTQFSGAANDNLFKFAFTVMLTYQLSVDWLPPAMAGLVIGALFILPFLLFSATSGQLADKYDKTRVIRFVKNLEVVIMLIAGYGFMANNVVVLLLCTFLM